MYRITRTVLFVGYMLMAFPFLFSQDGRMRKFTKEDGLPSNSVYGVQEDRNGYIWVFTEKGVAKYDGYTFKNFGLQDGLRALDVWDISIDSKNRIWLHTLKGLVYIQKDSVHQLWIDAVHDLKFHTLYEDGNQVWVDNGVERLLLRNDSLIRVPASANSKKALQAYQKGKLAGNVLLSFPNSLATTLVFDDGRLTELNANNELIRHYEIDKNWIRPLFHKNNQKSALKPIVFAQEDELIFITPLGIGKWSIKEKKGHAILFENRFGGAFPEDSDVKYTRGFNGNLQVMLGSGFMFEIDRDLNIIDYFDFRTTKAFHRIYKDREGNVWAGTGNDGIYLLPAQARSTKVYVEAGDERILSLVADRNGHVFYGTDNGSVYYFKNGISQRLALPPGWGDDVNDMLLNAEGGLFFGAQKKAFFLDTHRPFAEWNVKNFQTDYKITFAPKTILEVSIYGQKRSLAIPLKALCWNPHSKTLLASTGRELHRIDFSKAPLLLADIQTLDRVQSLVSQSTDTAWAGTLYGLKMIQRDTILDKSHLHPLLQKNIIALAVDSKDMLWVGTEGNGVYGFQSDTVFPISATERDFVLSVFVDEEDQLWVGTENGVKQFYIDPQEVGKTQLVRTYSLADGLLSSEVNAIAVDSHYVYFGSNKGLVQIEKSPSQGAVVPPFIYVDDISINGATTPLAAAYDLGYQQRELEISFTGISYQSFGKLSYSYQLAPIDKGWQSTTSRSVRYPELAPGEYTFYLQVEDINGVITRLQQPLHFVIRPPFWAIWWFRILAVIGIASVVFGIYKLRIRAIATKEAAKTAVNKKFAELELQALQAQMNPHFVYNALASIQYFIQENNTDEAEDYLAKFAKLMRSFLESSKTRYTTLEEELQLLRLYISMEQLRFEDRFEISTSVGAEIDPSVIKIPTLLLQPFIENAIHHGLFHKKGKGLLQVSFEYAKANTTVICRIEDNGIGRKAASNMRANSLKGYKSRGLQIVEERLAVLRNVENYDISIDVQDLVNQAGEATGTLVVITIPVIDEF